MQTSSWWYMLSFLSAIGDRYMLSFLPVGGACMSSNQLMKT